MCVFLRVCIEFGMFIISSTLQSINGCYISRLRYILGWSKGNGGVTELFNDDELKQKSAHFATPKWRH